MAPEIKKRQVYNGKSTDIFAVGVVIYILVKGQFPFVEATQEDFYFKMLSEGDYEKYWQTVKASHLSEEFKDLILRILTKEGDERLTI